MSYDFAMNEGDLWDGQMLSVKIGENSVLLLKKGGQIYAYEDRCLHKNVPLSQGRLDGEVITCCAHSWQFHATSGKGINPCGIALRSYPVNIQDGCILIEVTHDTKQTVKELRRASAEQP